MGSTGVRQPFFRPPKIIDLVAGFAMTPDGFKEDPHRVVTFGHPSDTSPGGMLPEKIKTRGGRFCKKSANIQFRLLECV